jgi:Fur family ferric uptake transcriptional regulator
MKSAEEAFSTYLTEHGLKMTPQRRTILDAFLRTADHISSEELYDMVKRSDESIGQATVYRTLKLMADSGPARPTTSATACPATNLSGRQEHHDHLICESCRKTIEIMDPTIERRQTSWPSATASP